MASLTVRISWIMIVCTISGATVLESTEIDPGELQTAFCYINMFKFLLHGAEDAITSEGELNINVTCPAMQVRKAWDSFSFLHLVLLCRMSDPSPYTSRDAHYDELMYSCSAVESCAMKDADTSKGKLLTYLATWCQNHAICTACFVPYRGNTMQWRHFRWSAFVAMAMNSLKSEIKCNFECKLRFRGAQLHWTNLSLVIIEAKYLSFLPKSWHSATERRAEHSLSSSSNSRTARSEKRISTVSFRVLGNERTGELTSWLST